MANMEGVTEQLPIPDPETDIEDGLTQKMEGRESFEELEARIKVLAPEIEKLKADLEQSLASGATTQEEESRRWELKQKIERLVSVALFVASGIVMWNSPGKAHVGAAFDVSQLYAIGGVFGAIGGIGMFIDSHFSIPSETVPPNRAELEEKVSEFETLVSEARALTTAELIAGGAEWDEPRIGADGNEYRGLSVDEAQRDEAAKFAAKDGVQIDNA